ncbi:Hypothetical predicted protein [Xyrichtys novacula]|uniref:Chemokine interleukin-8-like domain-containing protein n=1 Tax=Xyrichtys novacula TaxID=13765 RepID=A0AAV1HAB1_XYRNO|nr:Hypothetical predicted protein [Xyrichtys novacula]
MSLKILSITVLLFMGSLGSSAASQETRYERSLSVPCCYEAGPYIRERIIECIRQIPTRQCNFNNYVVKTESGEWYCIQSESKWMKSQIQKGAVVCTPEI